jgi:hypothetical protein
VVVAEAPQLETMSVSFREAGVVAFGGRFVGAVAFGLLLFRRRSRRQR